MYLPALFRISNKTRLLLCLFLLSFFAYTQDIEALLKQSRQALEQNQIKEAIRYAEAALQLAPNSAEAYNAKGLAHYAFSEYEQALTAYTKAISLKTSYKDAYYNRGVCYYWISKNDLALADFQKAIELDPKDARSYVALGALYAKISSLTSQRKESKKYIDLAEKSYQTAISVNPEYPQSYFNYASLIAENHPQKALKLIEEFLRKKPNDVEGLVLAGTLHNSLKKYTKAIETLEKAITLNKNHSEAFAELAWANHQLKRKTEACDNWLKAKQLGNTEVEELLKRYCK